MALAVEWAATDDACLDVDSHYLRVWPLPFEGGWLPSPERGNAEMLECSSNLLCTLLHIRD